MADAQRRVHVESPRDLNELLAVTAHRPDATLVAGGTALMAGWPPRAARGSLVARIGPPARAPEGAFPERLIDLAGVSELARMSRTERWVDLGAMLPLSRLLSVGRNVLPKALLRAVSRIGTPAVRNQATLGGNVCLAVPFADTVPVLFALDALVELRAVTGSRWLPIALFLGAASDPALRPGEVLTRVRVPLGAWDCAEFRKVSLTPPPSQSLLGFCGLAHVQRGVLVDLRIAVSGLCVLERGAALVHRDRAGEVALAGERLPIGRQLREQFAERFAASLARRPDALPADSYAVGTALRLCAWFFDRLNHLRVRP